MEKYFLPFFCSIAIVIAAFPTFGSDERKEIQKVFNEEEVENLTFPVVRPSILIPGKFINEASRIWKKTRLLAEILEMKEEEILTKDQKLQLRLLNQTGWSYIKQNPIRLSIEDCFLSDRAWPSLEKAIKNKEYFKFKNKKMSVQLLEGNLKKINRTNGMVTLIDYVKGVPIKETEFQGIFFLHDGRLVNPYFFILKFTEIK